MPELKAKYVHTENDCTNSVLQKSIRLMLSLAYLGLVGAVASVVLETLLMHLVLNQMTLMLL